MSATSDTPIPSTALTAPFQASLGRTQKQPRTAASGYEAKKGVITRTAKAKADDSTKTARDKTDDTTETTARTNKTEDTAKTSKASNKDKIKTEFAGNRAGTLAHLISSSDEQELKQDHSQLIEILRKIMTA